MRHSVDFPINEAALVMLFELSSSPDDRSERGRRLRMVPLNAGQLEDVANFAEIRQALAEYSDCFNRRYPDSLAELVHYERGYCYMRGLDSLYTHDRYGRGYIYVNLVNFVILGSPGENHQWDFDQAIMDSIHNDQMEHIYVSGDDIIAKFKPDK